jgi:hypothetical protein
MRESKHGWALGFHPLYSKFEAFWPRPPSRASTYFLLLGNQIAPTALTPNLCVRPSSSLQRSSVPYVWQDLAQACKYISTRCCVDARSKFWITGYRCRCRHYCLHPKTRKRIVTGRSWDHRILVVLLPAQAAEFPAELTHCSGISKFLRRNGSSSFQTQFLYNISLIASLIYGWVKKVSSCLCRLIKITGYMGMLTGEICAESP